MSSIIFSMVIYFVVLLVFIECMRKSPRASLGFAVCSLFLMPIIFTQGAADGAFRIAKVLSVIIPLIIVGLARISITENRLGKFWKAFDKKWILYFTFCILCLNIFEATAADFAAGNYANAFAGLVLLVTTPLAIKFWTIERKPKGDLLTFTTMFWNILYSTWNAAFVYGESPQFFAGSLCIITIALVYPLVKRRSELWLPARIYTLGLHLVIRGCCPFLFLNYMNAKSWQNESFLKWFGIFNAVIALGYVVWYFYSMIKKTYKKELVEKYNTIHQFDATKS